MTGQFSLEVQVAVLLQPLHSEFTVACPRDSPFLLPQTLYPRTYPQSSLHSIPLASCLHPLSSANGNTPTGRRVFQNSTHNLFEFQLQHNHFSVHLGISLSLFCPSAASSVIHCYKMSWRHNPGLQGSRTHTRCCLCMNCPRDACQPSTDRL